MAGPLLYDRIKETTTTTGTGTITLAGAETHYRSFADVGNGNTTFYCIEHQSANEWEVGIGTYTASGTTLARTVVLRTSAGDANAVNFSAGVKSVYVVVPALSARALLNLQHICNGRITTETGVPISTSDRTAQGTIYFTPWGGNQIALYNGSAWVLHTFTERSLALTATSGKNYDVFLYDNSGTLTLELSAAWTNDTTRADALTTQDGVVVKSGATTRRWVGFFRANGTNVTADAANNRLVQQIPQNRVSREIRCVETNNSWTYTTTLTWRQANASSANQIGLLSDGTEMVDMTAIGQATDSSVGGGIFAGVAIGFDQTSGPDAKCVLGLGGVGLSSTIAATPVARYSANLALGYHYAAWLEFTSTSGTTTFYGVVAPSGTNYRQTGISGTWRC